MTGKTTQTAATSGQLFTRAAIALGCLTAVLLSGCVYATDPNGNIVAVAPVAYNAAYAPVDTVPGTYGYDSGYYADPGYYTTGGLYRGNNAGSWGSHHGYSNNGWANRGYYNNGYHGYAHGNYSAAHWTGARGSAVVVHGGSRNGNFHGTAVRTGSGRTSVVHVNGRRH